MRSKLLLSIGGGCLLMAGAIAAFHEWSFYSLTTELERVERAVETVGHQIAAVKEQMILQSKAEGVANVLKTKAVEKQELETEIQRLEIDTGLLAEAMERAVQKTREQSVGMTFAEVVLVKGSSLKEARIHRVTEEAVSFQHREGVTTVRVDDLPLELRDRLRLKQGTAKTVGIASGPPMARPAAPVVAEKPAMAEVPYEEQLRQYQKRVLEAELSLQRMSLDMNTLYGEARAADRAARDAKTPTQRYYSRTRSEQLEIQLAESRRRLENGRIELKRLKGDVPQAPARK